jgi:hypothetical protein
MRMGRESVIQVKLSYVMLDEVPEEMDARTNHMRIVILREEGAEFATFENGKVEYFPLE